MASMPLMAGIADAGTDADADGIALSVIPDMPGMADPVPALEPQAASVSARADAARVAAAARRRDGDRRKEDMGVLSQVSAVRGARTSGRTSPGAPRIPRRGPVVLSGPGDAHLEEQLPTAGRWRTPAPRGSRTPE